MKKTKIKNKIVINSNPDTGHVFVESIDGNVTSEEIEQAKKDYWEKGKKFAAKMREAAELFDAEYLNKK
jgi:hypothetical protein